MKKLFSVINTKNFELIMQQLDNFAEIAKVFSSDTNLVNKINEASLTLKNSLIDAVKELHPEHVIMKQTEEQGAAFFFKQWGAWSSDGVKRSKKTNGKLIMGKIYQKMPA